MSNEFDYLKFQKLLYKHKRLFAVVSLAVMTLGVGIGYILPKKYVAQSVVYVSRSVLNDLVRGIAVTPSVEETLRGLDSTMKSRSVLSKVVNDLDLNLNKQSETRVEGLIDDLRNRTDLQLNDKEGLITIKFTDQNPRIARDYINALVRHYIEENLSTKREESYGAASFLSEQIASVKVKLDRSNAEISKFRREKGSALAGNSGGVQIDISAAQQHLDDLALRRSQLEISRNQLRSSNPVRARLVTLQRRLEELRVEYTDNYPEVIKVKSDIEAAQHELARGGGGVADPHELARIEAEINAVRMSEARQRATIATNRGPARENPIVRSELDKLEQERHNYQTLYDQLVARSNQAEVSKQMEVQDKSTTFKILEPAVMPAYPISPNRVRIILMGIAAGIAAGIGLLMAIDFFDKSIKSMEELKSFGVPVVAVIPKISDPNTVALERRRDRRCYTISGMYFSAIVALLVFEFIGVSPVDEIVRFISG